MNEATVKILYLVQLPPPVHGASIANENIVNSKVVNAGFTTRVIDIKTSRNIEEIGGFSIRKLFQTIILFCRIVAKMIFFRPHIIYFTLSPTGFAFYRDAFFIFFIKFFRGKLLFHLHGKGIRAGARKKIFRSVAKRIFKSSYVIHLSERLTNDTGEFNYKKNFIVNYGITVAGSHAEVQKRNHTTQLLFLSNYVRSKGVVDLVDAIVEVSKTNQNFHLNLVGKPYDVSIEELQQRIESYNLQGKISVCGPKYGEDKFKELVTADIFVFPTYYFNEAFPLSLLEAMQFGLPVVTTQEGGIPDMVEDGKTGILIEKRDVPALASGIAYLINNPETRKQMGDQAKKVFFEKYTLNIFEKNIRNVVESVLKD